MDNETRKKVKLKTSPMRFSDTQKLVSRISDRLGGAFITYWNSPNGQVCQDDVQALYEVLERVGKQDSLYLLVKSGGGQGTASLRIVNTLHRYAKRVVVLVPLESASAATMIALGAHEIRMGPLAYLTAIDTSLEHPLSPVNTFNARVSVAQDELNRVVRLWKTETEAGIEDVNPYGALYEHVHPLVIGAVDRASSLSVKLCVEILGYHLDSLDKAREIAEALNSAYPAHDYPILPDEAKRLGLNVSELDEDLNTMLLDLHELYSEMGQEAVTDYDETNYHINETANITEAPGIQILYKIDKDWHYRTEERRWAPLNDESSWRRLERKNGKIRQSVFHIR
ncbi:MAG: ATP-dependent Clp protease proteolytic subunit [Myxococcota bacterium]